MPTVYYVDASYLTVLDSGSNPAALGNSGQGTGEHLDQGTITFALNTEISSFEGSDDEPYLNDNDSDQVITDAGTTGLTTGQDFEAEYTLVLEDGVGNQYTVHGISVGPGYSNVVGLAVEGNFPPLGEVLTVVSYGEGPDKNGTDLGYGDLADTICFTPGTLVRTATGLRPIESLQVGDLVPTRDGGAQPIRWIGRSDISSHQLRAQPALKPILLKAGCFGSGMPARDMLVSPHHRLLLSDWRAEILFGQRETLAAAHSLRNDRTILRRPGEASVTYIHMLFDQHHIIEADGILAESFQPLAPAFDGLAEKAREELFQIMPQLRVGDLSSAITPARRVLREDEVRAFLSA